MCLKYDPEISAQGLSWHLLCGNHRAKIVGTHLKKKSLRLSTSGSWNFSSSQCMNECRYRAVHGGVRLPQLTLNIQWLFVPLSATSGPSRGINGDQRPAKVKDWVTQIEAHAAGTVKLQLAYQISYCTVPSIALLLLGHGGNSRPETCRRPRIFFRCKTSLGATLTHGAVIWDICWP